jgi:subtilase family serine protease
MREEVCKSSLRLVSAIVVLNLAFGGFLGLMLIEENGTVTALTLPMPDPDNVVVQSADLYIDGSTLDNNTLGIDANWRVTNNRVCTLVDTNLVFQVDTNHRWTFTVELGGTLVMINSTITVETSDKGGALFDNYENVNWFNSTNNAKARFRRMVPFNMLITGVNSNLYMSQGSALKWEGGLTFAAGGNGTISDSVISSPSAPYSTYDWGIVVHIEDTIPSSRWVVFEDSRIEKSPWFQGIAYVDPDDDGGNPAGTYVMYENHTITNSEVHLINTYWDLDYQNDTSPALNTRLPANNDDNVNHYPWFVNPSHNALEISSNSKVNFYGLTIDMSETSDAIPPTGSTAINVLDAGSDVTVYRWLAVTPVDSAGVALNGVSVTVTTIKGAPVDAQVNGLIDALYCDPAWDYVDRSPHAMIVDAGASLTGITGTSGKLIFPLASDKITQGGWPNSDQFPDGYNIQATYPAPLETVNALVDFENFPRMFPGDNFVDKKMPAFSFAAPHPELYPEFIITPPTSELENVIVNLSIRVWNAIVGPGQDASNVMVQFWDGDPNLNTSTKIGETTIPLITAGTNQTVWMNWLASPAGAHTIYIGVDRNWDSPFLDDLIPEENENNNVITAPITVLERPDLFINGSYISFSLGNVVVNGSAFVVNAQVLNIGGSTASNVVVNFYDGTASGPGAFIGSDTILSVQPGSSQFASIGWGPDVGFHYVWVFVDELPLPDGLILEKDEGNNVASQSIDVKSRPDLNPTIVFDPNDPQYEGTEITVQAIVANSGGWNVTSAVTVKFYKDDLDNLIGTKVIPTNFEGISIHANGGSQTVSVTWTATYPPASHTFFVVVDPDGAVDESNEANNMATDTFIVDPRPNLEITSSDITVTDPYPSDGDNVVINFDIHNTGLSEVTDDFYVRIWLDEVGGSGTLLNEYLEISNILPGNSIPGSYPWNGVTPAGRHDIWVVVDYNNTVAETSETDNAAAGEIVIFKVPSDLIVNNAAYYPGFSPSPGIVIINGFTSTDPYDRDGYTLVEENGLLIIRDSVFQMVGQGEDYEFNIVVKDTGTLTIDEDSFITTEQYLVNIYLFDSATLNIDGSTIDTKINIIAADNSEVYITEQSAIYGNIFADEATSGVYLRIVNSTLTNKLENIGGGTQVDLWGVFIAGAPASDNTVTVSDSAIVYIDWFLTMNIVDVNDAGIVGAQVMWYRSPPWKDTGSQTTGASGIATFRLRGMNITATSVVSDIGSYIVVSDFTSPFTLITYYPDANVTLEMTTNKVKTIKYSTVMPDLDPPIFVTYQFSILSVGDTATVTSWVNNTGPSPANDVYVVFDDDAPGEGGWPKTFLNDTGIGPGESWKIVFTWIPQMIGWHNISVYIDPSNLIIEGNESNNFNSTPVFVTPQKADLMIESTDISFTKDPSNPYGPTENDTITVHAIISNIGETNAFPVPELAVAYYIGDSGGPITLIGWGNISGVSAKQSVASSFSWSSTTPPGTYWIWVQVDPNLLVDETLEDNNEAGNTVYIKQYADVTPVGLEFLVNDIAQTSVPDTTLVTLKATVQNLGETNAQNVRVTFYDGLPGIGQQIGNTQIIPFILAISGSETAEVVWEATVIGLSQDHNISVLVSGVEENIQDNNEITRTLTVTLRPILSVEDIDFSDNSPFEGESFSIFAEIMNSGGTAASTFAIDFWDGDPIIGTLIGSETLSLGINGTGKVSVSWTSPTGGAHDINVVVDPANIIDEANENNNNASEVIVVYSSTDLIVTTEPPFANSPYNIGTEFAPEPLAPQHRGYTLVEAEGILTMTYTTFTILQSSNYQFNIIVRNNGTFIIEKGSTLITNGPLMRIYLYDDATLMIEESLIASSIIEIVASGNSQIVIDESTVGSFIKADEATANVMLDATNSSLTQAFSQFGGSSQATFTSVITPSVELQGSAQLTVYQWLNLYVRDGAGTGISGSDINVSNLFSGIEIPDSPKTTGSEGLALFKVLTDILTPTTETSTLSYSVSAEYLYDTILYTGSTSVTFTSYVDDKNTNFVEAVITLSDLKPDLFVDTTSIRFYKDGLERFTVGVDEIITINATVKNVGTAGTTPMTQVLVRFYHEMKNGNLMVLGEDVIDTPMDAQTGEGIATILWIPQDSEAGDNEEIWITVDPNNAVAELQESQDNTAFTSVNIIRPPDLAVGAIKFNIAGFANIDNTTESELVTITASISNIGTDRQAVSINVSFYDGFPDFDGDMKPDSPLPTGVVQIGSAIMISNLAQRTSRTVSVEWDTTGKQKGHLIYVYALDSTAIGYISDQILENNNNSESFVVLPKPDLEPTALPPQTESIVLLTSDGSILSGNPQIGQRLTLSGTIFNNGQVYIHAVDVTFWDGNPDTNGDLIIDTGATQIGGNVTISIPPNSPMNASVTWDVAEPAGDIRIYVWVNPSQNVIESDYANNIDDVTFTVSFASVEHDFTVDLKSKYDVGDTLEIRTWLTFTDTSTGLPNQPYTIRILNNNNQPYGNPFTGTTDNNGNIHRDIPVPTSAGTYHVEIEIDYGGSILLTSPNFSVEEEGGLPLPFEWIILIIIIAVLVVIFAGVAMARLGVGKLVECGECGAFIHEGDKKCPKCGAVFETDTAKCSECGSWIPVDSKSCPECGAIFAGLEKEKKGYIEKMKVQYAEYVDQFRSEAKADLGTAFNDEEFMRWWKTSPKYVGFEDWLSREEELKKGRTKNCPSCNTVNPQSAAICFKCGTVFRKKEEAPPELEKPPGRPPAEVPAKRVARPPAERRGEAPPTVVPKKVVRPPEVVPKKVVKKPPTVVPKKVVKRPPPEDE